MSEPRFVITREYDYFTVQYKGRPSLFNWSGWQYFESGASECGMSPTRYDTVEAAEEAIERFKQWEGISKQPKVVVKTL